MIRPGRLALVILLATMMGRVWLADFRLFGAVADPLLLVAVVTALLIGSDRGARVGFVTGLVTDLFLHTPFGLWALSHTVAAYAIGRAGEVNIRAAGWTVVAAGAVGSALGYTIFALIGTILGLSHLVDLDLLVTIGVIGLLNGLLALPATRVVGWATAPPPRIRAGVGGGW